MVQLADRFTDTQVFRLNSIGITTLYDLITYLPLGLQKVIPMNNFSKDQQGLKYLANATLLNVERRRGGRFLVLEFEHNYRFKCYLFSVASYTLKNLKAGKNYQLILTYKNGFWNLERYAVLSNLEEDKLILGKAKMAEYIDVYYSKNKSLTSNYFKSLFKRLLRLDFILNLEGLVPEDVDIIPQIIDLYKIHFPKSEGEYKESFDHWLSLRLFLKLALARYIETKEVKELVARNSLLDLDYLKYMTSKIGFELSLSQKLATWDIVQDVCFDNIDKT